VSPTLSSSAIPSGSLDPVGRNPIGTHITVGKGLTRSLVEAVEAGFETVQIFAGNPRGWALSAGDPAEDTRFNQAREELGVRVFIHAPYLVNPGSPTAQTYQRSLASVAHNLKRAAELGAEGVVVHTGSSVQTGAADSALSTALQRVHDGLLPLLEAIESPEAPWLLLEPTAGQGRSLCAGVEDLEAYLAAVDFHPKAGICLDTCHVFAAGAPLDEPGGATATLDRVIEIGGRERFRLIHANDSQDVRGKLLDRHQRIGQGYIGVRAFAELFAHPATQGVPFVLETPGSRDPESPDLAVLKALRELAAAGALSNLGT
jgi:deoxyribonuclease-4